MIKKIRAWLEATFSPKTRKVMVGVIGSLVIIVGVMMIFIPGPAIVVIPAGFAILAMEFEWARRGYDKVKEWMQKKGWIQGEKKQAEPAVAAKGKATPIKRHEVAHKRTVVVKRRQKTLGTNPKAAT